MSIDNRMSNQTLALKRKKMFLARVEWLPVTSRSHVTSQTDKSKISIMILLKPCFSHAALVCMYIVYIYNLYVHHMSFVRRCHCSMAAIVVLKIYYMFTCTQCKTISMSDSTVCA